MSIVPTPVARQPWGMLFPLFVLIGFGALVLMYVIGLAILVFGGFDYERAKKKMVS